MCFNLPFFPLASLMTILGISRMARIVIALPEKKIASLKPQARFLEMPCIIMAIGILELLLLAGFVGLLVIIIAVVVKGSK